MKPRANVSAISGKNPVAADLDDDLSAFGLIAETAQPDLPEDDPDTFAVWPENWDTVRVFIALGTQWRREYAGMDAVLVWQGLRYGEAEAVIRLMGLARQARDIFDGLRLMESAALPVLNKR